MVGWARKEHLGVTAWPAQHRPPHPREQAGHERTHHERQHSPHTLCAEVDLKGEFRSAAKGEGCSGGGGFERIPGLSQLPCMHACIV